MLTHDVGDWQSILPEVPGMAEVSTAVLSWCRWAQSRGDCDCVCVCVCAGMSVDLQAQPCFSLDLPKENWSPEEYEDCPLVRLGRHGSAGSSRSSRRNK